MGTGGGKSTIPVINASDAETSVVGRIFLFLFGLIFVGVACIATWSILDGTVQQLSMLSWTATPCTIIARDVHAEGVDTRMRYHFTVSYSYQVQGRNYSGVEFRPAYSGESDYREVDLPSLRYTVGSQATCLVKPGEPTTAFLERGSLLKPRLLVLLVTAIFLALGLLFLKLSVFGSARTSPAGRSLTHRGRSGSGRGQIALGVVLLAVGVAIGLPTAILPGIWLLRAASWTPMNCMIESQQMLIHRDSEGDSYRAEIVYAYDVGGVTHRSNTLHFSGSLNGSQMSARRWLEAYPTATRAFCYVSPRDPSLAVLNRDPGPSLFFGLIPLVLGVVGIVLIQRGRTTHRMIAEASSILVAPGSANVASDLGRPTRLTRELRSGGRIVLPPRGSGKLNFLMLTVFAIGLGIATIAMWRSIIMGFQRGRPEYILVLFGCIVGLFALAFLGGAIYQLLALFNPKITLGVVQRDIPLGGELDLKWRIGRLASAIERLTITLVASEHATYMRGTTSYTDVRAFYTQTLLNTDDLDLMRAGGATVTLPADCMHTFTAHNNRIVWSIKVHGEIHRWPDLHSEHDIVVLPIPGATLAATIVATPSGIAP